MNTISSKTSFPFQTNPEQVLKVDEPQDLFPVQETYEEVDSNQFKGTKEATSRGFPLRIITLFDEAGYSIGGLPEIEVHTESLKVEQPVVLASSGVKSIPSSDLEEDSLLWQEVTEPIMQFQDSRANPGIVFRIQLKEDLCSELGLKRELLCEGLLIFKRVFHRTKGEDDWRSKVVWVNEAGEKSTAFSIPRPILINLARVDFSKEPKFTGPSLTRAPQDLTELKSFLSGEDPCYQLRQEPYQYTPQFPRVRLDLFSPKREPRTKDAQKDVQARRHFDTAYQDLTMVHTVRTTVAGWFEGTLYCPEELPRERSDTSP